MLTRTAAPELLAIGETMAMVTPLRGRLDADAQLVLHAGGAESNVAAMLAGLGRRTAWASALGADPLGDVVLEAVARRGVDVSLVQRDPERPTGVYFKDPTTTGTRVYYYRRGSAASALGDEALQQWVAVRPEIVHVSAITAAISPAGAALLRRIIVDRVFGDALVSFDVNHRPGLWSTEDAAGPTLDLAQHSDLVFVGRDEAAALWQTSTAESVRALVDRPRRLVVKDGPLEAVGFCGTDQVRAPARQVEVVDLVGAGDAYAAGWLGGHLVGATELAKLQLGHWLAAEVVGSISDFAEVPDVQTVMDQILAAGTADEGSAR